MADNINDTPQSPASELPDISAPESGADDANAAAWGQLQSAEEYQRPASIEHHQCAWCNEFTAGPLKGHNPGFLAGYVHEGIPYPNNPEGNAAAKAAGATRDDGISHGQCKKCRRNWLAKRRRIIHNREKQRQLEPPA